MGDRAPSHAGKKKIFARRVAKPVADVDTSALTVLRAKPTGMRTLGPSAAIGAGAPRCRQAAADTPRTKRTRSMSSKKDRGRTVDCKFDGPAVGWVESVPTPPRLPLGAIELSSGSPVLPRF